MIVLLLVTFWAMQVAAYVAFKCGSHGSTQRWWAGFIGGNIVGASSIYFLMRIYAAMPANSNLANVLAGGGAFVCIQLVLALVFRSRLTVRQWLGIALVAAGSALATLGGPGVTK